MKVIKTFSRVYVNNINSALPLYEQLLGEKCSQRFKYSETNLELAIVGQIIVIAGSDDALREYRTTNATFIVDSVQEIKEFIILNKGSVIRDIRVVPTGLNLTMKNSDGSIIEYVQFKN